MDFATKLLEWSSSITRHMPWKGEKDPYKIWLSEIILQQTRVEQGWSYYLKFVETFPNIIALAQTDIDVVLKMWQGLGYYSRARSLHATAQNIVTNYQGIFPTKYEDVIKLKGIGPYTAAAICSFAYDDCIPVIDGNVTRVLARYYGITSPVDEKEALLKIKKIAVTNISKKYPALYNQAIMDFGATLCKPQNPYCNNCPFSDNCIAYTEELIDVIPFKSKKTIIKKRYFNFLIIQTNQGFLVEKRQGNDIWNGLYQFPMIETSDFESEVNSLLNFKFKVEFSNSAEKTSEIYTQKLTHQLIHARFIWINKHTVTMKNDDNFVSLNAESKNKFAFPKIISTFLEKHLLILN